MKTDMGDDAEYYMELEEKEKHQAAIMKDAVSDQESRRIKKRELEYLQNLKLTNPEEYRRKMKLFYNNEK